MLNCIIIDDEPLAIDLLKDYVSKTQFLELLESFTNPIEAMHFVNDNDVDLILLDIQMPELTGIQFMKIMQDKSNFILTTAYDKFALEGYEYDVIDFLLKPITFERFMVAANKAKDRLVNLSDSINKESQEPKDYIFVKSEYKIQKVDLSDILYLEGMGDYINIQRSSGKLLTLENIKSFHERLPNSRFLRVHKSYIISLEKIDFIERNRVKIGNKLIPISNTYQKEFWERVK